YPPAGVALAIPQLQIEPEQARRVVFLLDACSGVERRLLLDHIRDNPPPGPYETIPIPSSRRRGRRRGLDRRLEAAVAAADDPLFTPLRVAWMAVKRPGGPRRRLLRLLMTGDPRDPGALRQMLVKHKAGRCQVVFGDAARLSELRDRWRKAGGADGSETTG